MADESFLDLLRAAAAGAAAAETALRARFSQEIRGLERARVFASRRLALVTALAQTIEGAQDEAEAFAAGERALAGETGLCRANSVHGEHLDAFRPVIDAIDSVLNCEDEVAPASVLEALAAFERDYAARMGSEFLELYDVYRPETPVVDF